MARLRLGRGKGRAEELVVPEAGARPAPTREEQRRAAKKRLARAEAELERLEGKERRADRRIAARDRTVDRRLRRIESARGRRVWPLVAAIVALNAVASGLAVIHMFWPDLLLGEGVLVPDAGQWEFVAYLFIVCALASLAFIAYHPLAELHRRVRLAMSMYPKIPPSILLKSCAIPPAKTPRESNFCDFWAVSRSFCFSVMSRKTSTTPMMFPSSSRIGAPLSATINSLPSRAMSSVRVVSSMTDFVLRT